MDQRPQRQRVIEYIQDRYAVEPEYLWARYPNYAVFRQPASKKWFAIVMEIPQKSLNLEGEALVDVLNVKSGPILTGSLLTEPGVFPAYHMSKSSWVSILLDGSVPDEQIFPLLELSYDSVAPKRKKPRAQTSEASGAVQSGVCELFRHDD